MFNVISDIEDYINVISNLENYHQVLLWRLSDPAHDLK